MILADDARGRTRALAKLLPMQRGDFVELFRIMERAAGDDPAARSAAARIPAQDRGRDGRGRAAPPASTWPSLRHRAAALHETNPMLGHRGCRLGITAPEIYEMQARAIFEAAVAVTKETGKPRSSPRS